MSEHQLNGNGDRNGPGHARPAGHRVAITGIGPITAVGTGKENFWEGLRRERSPIRRITRFDVQPWRTRIAAEVDDFQPTDYVEPRTAKRMDRFAQLAMAASQEAVTQAGLDNKPAHVDFDRVGVLIGSGIGGISTFEEQTRVMIERGPKRISPFFVPMFIPDIAAGHVSMRYGMRGPNYCTVSACASSAHALGDALRIIQRGEADVMITGGTEQVFLSSRSYYDAAGKHAARHRASGNLRLDNLYLLPGTHYFRVSGSDTPYTLRLLPIGPASAMPEPAAAVADPAEQQSAAPGATEPDGETETLSQRDRPPGLPEREPNDAGTTAELLRFGEPRIGLLTTHDDSDYFRFNLPAPQHVRLTVTPPADGNFIGVLRWGSYSLGRAFAGPDGLITGQEWLPAGEYHLQLYAEVPSEDWYQVTLERLSPFSVAPGRDSDFPEWFGRYEDEATLFEPASLDLSMALRPDSVDAVAAYWPYGQRFDLELAVSNPHAEALELTFDGHASDGRWQLEVPGSLSLAPGEEQAVRVPVVIASEVPDEPVVLTVSARSADGRQSTADVTFAPDAMASPVGSHLWYPLPQALLGGLDAAWTGLGAEIFSSSPDEETLVSRFDVPFLFDGMAPLHHDFMDYRMYDRVPQDLGMSEFPLTVRLAGTEPVELAGFLLNPTSTDHPAAALKDFAVSVSLDGQEFTEVLRAELSPIQAEQAFVLPEPVMARYVRLHLLANQVASATPHLDAMRLGTFKAVTTLESAALLTGGAGLNIADPRVGGHPIWSDPGSMAHSNRMLRADEYVETIRLGWEQEQAHWVVGFHHERAAQIEQFEWLEHEGEANSFQLVELSVAVDSPTGPWTPIGTWDVAENPAHFQLEEPVWARYVRFSAINLTPRDTYRLPEAISIIERATGADYSSAVGEWGHYSRLGPLEQQHADVLQEAQTAGDNGSRETAATIAPGERLQGTVELGEQEAWYRLSVPAGMNHLSVTLSGLPHRGFDYELSDASGEAVAVQEEATSTEITIAASVLPGDYLLRIFEPPRSIVITWDTSGSVAGALPIIYKALETFAQSISPGVEEVNLLPFDSPFLLRNWSGEPLRVLEAIQADPRNTSSSSGEAALLQATQALAERPGKKAVILLTDGAVVRTSELWATLAEVQPHIFASSISSAGAFGPNAPAEQDLMQSYASVNGGHYEYVHSQGDFDVSFRRAAAWLRRPSHYTLSMEVDQRWENASAWAVPELQRAADHGLIPAVLAGADLTGSITRAEFAAVAVRVYEALTGEEAVPAAINPFTDTDDSEVLKAFNTELAVGISSTEFAPDQLLNREQAATILTRVFKKVNLPDWTWATDAQFPLEFDAPEPFTDHERISAWASESVYFMAANGIITGTGSNQFTPRAVTPEEQASGYANATREQALLLAVRLVESR